MLIANAGVLIGIIAIIFELQQTQTAMQAEASSMRTLMAIDNQDLNLDLDWVGLQDKVGAGQTLTEEEERNLRRVMFRALRTFENLHYHWELGILDEEIWQSNLQGISNFHDIPGFVYLYSDWPDARSAGIFRESFVDLVVSFREQ